MNRTRKFKLTPCFICMLLAYSAITHAEKNLSSVYVLAEQQDPRFAQANVNRNIANEIWYESLGQLLPDLSMSAKTSGETLDNRKNTFQNIGKQKFWKSTIDINLTQPLFRWDAWVQLTQADNEVAKSEVDFFSAKQNLMLRVAEAYFNVLASQDQWELTRSEITAIQEQLNQAKAALSVGVGKRTDVYEAEAAYAKAMAREIETLNLLGDSKEVLKEIVGDVDIELHKIGDDIPLVRPQPENIQEWADVAIQNNLDIISSFNQLEISRKEVSRQWAGHLPSLDLVGHYGVADDSSSFGLRGDTGSFGMQLSMPIFQGGSTQARINKAEYQVTIAEQDFESIQRQVRKEVRNAFRGVMSELSRVQALATAVEASEQAVEGVKAGLKEGTRTMVDVLSEQRFLYLNKVDYAQARYTYLLNGLRLKKWTSTLDAEDLQSIDKL
ncbi:MAG: TolC family outer membrane protein [Methylococcaceae bacterium]|nr:TolC family outer membrane protein [Methylococcaceae bacterium]